MNIKILICGYNLYGYLDSIAKGFKKCGCDVLVFSHSNISIRKLRNINPIKNLYARLRLKKINEELKKLFITYMPNIILCINASSIYPETVYFMSKRAITVLWLVDSVERVATRLETINLFKKIFVFEPTDMLRIKAADFLPYGFDEDIYFRKNKQKMYEVSFVGAGHIERYEPLDKIAEACRVNRIKFYVFGPFSLFKNKLYKRRFPFLYESVLQNRRFFPSEINEIYNKTIININIHHPQSKEGVNPRVFEIAGSGNFQIVDYKRSIYNLFYKDEIITFFDIGELLEKIKYFLKEKNIAISIADKSMKRALSKHTFRHRAEYILKRVLGN